MKWTTKPEARVRHLTNLSVILGVSYEETKVIFKDLKAIEMRGHKLAEDYCNGVVDSEQYEQAIDKLKERLKALIKNEVLRRNLYLNGDPRGYFLKIDDDYTRQNKLNIETDWGGYGIICPEEI